MLEPVQCYLVLARNLCENETSLAGAWNFGPDMKDCISVEDVISLGARVPFTKAAGPPPPETYLLRLDSSKAFQDLASKPKLSARTSLEWKARLLREDLGGADAATVTRRLIEELSAL